MAKTKELTIPEVMDIIKTFDFVSKLQILKETKELVDAEKAIKDKEITAYNNLNGKE